MGKTPRPLTKCNVAARRNARNFNDYRAQLLPNSGLSRWSLTALNVMAAKAAMTKEMQSQRRNANNPVSI